MQEISEPEYKNLTSLEKMKGLPLATSGNAASISSIFLKYWKPVQTHKSMD